MTTDLPRLVQAILTRAKEQDGLVTKTKLLKYLYLFDIAAYRATGQMLTNFRWIFHKYGPWAEQFEQMYDKWQGVVIDVKNAGDAPFL